MGSAWPIPRLVLRSRDNGIGNRDSEGKTCGITASLVQGRIRGEGEGEVSRTLWQMMERLWIPSHQTLGGRMLPFLRHYCVFGSHHPLTWSGLQTTERKHNQNGGWIAQCAASGNGPSVSDINGAQKDFALPDSLLCNARILYCASPAMGHNKESHPESNKRVPAIVDALEKLELTPKHRGSQVLEIQNFHPASLDDVARVHSRKYITGLEKAMSRASDEGLIFIEGTGPTYATQTTFQESLLAAGAGITLVDSVCSFPKKCCMFS